jgi:HK97 gp10 family phage protein
MSLRWYGEERKREIEREMRQRVKSAVREVYNRARILVDEAGTAKRKGKAKVYGAVRSLPGEPPRKQTGQLRRSIASEVLSLVGRVGTNVKYGKHLELGTRHMQPRPWLRRALNESRGKIEAILKRPIR